MLNENIRTIRKNKGFTQEDLANRLHVTRQTISKWEKGYSVPDAEMLTGLADILDVPVSELLGGRVESAGETDAVVEQLSRLNEQLTIKNRRAHRIWKTVGICIAVIALVCLLTAVAGFVLFVNVKQERNTVAGSVEWTCELDGEEYVYGIEYNENYQVLTSGGDAYIANRADIDQYAEDANVLAAHLKDYVEDKGGTVTVTKRTGLELNE